MKWTCVLLGLLLGPVSAATAEQNAHVFDFAVGTNLTDFNYKEMSTSPDDSESGLFESLLVDAKYYPFQTATNIEAVFETAESKLNYWASGTFTNPNQSISQQMQNDFSNYTIYFNFALSEDVEMYVGYGYDYWRRNGGNYYDDYTWNYLPVGIRAWLSQSNIVDVGADISIIPTLNADFKVIPFNGQDSSGALGSSIGMRLSIPVRWTLSDNLIFTTTPWLEYRRFGHSGVVYNSAISPGPLAEPDSQTVQIGAELLAGVSY